MSRDERQQIPVAVVRRASMGDARGLARMRWDFSPDEQDTQSWGEFEKGFRTWLEGALQGSRWTSWVAEADGKLLGTVWLQHVEKVPRPGRFDGRFGYVTNTYVVPEARSRGVGGQLLDAVVAHAREVGLEFLVVWPSPESVDFYARAGFVTSGTAHAGADDYEVLELPL